MINFMLWKKTVSFSAEEMPNFIFSFNSLEFIFQNLLKIKQPYLCRDWLLE